MVIHSILKELREGVDEYFKQIFKDISDVVNLANVEICKPHICSRQIHRINLNPTNQEIFFKISVFFSFLDFIIQELDVQFNEWLSDIMSLQGLILSNFRM